jgi:signal transduction histidine kinase
VSPDFAPMALLRRSLRRRLLLAFALISGVLTLTYAVVVPVLALYTEDVILENVLRAEQQRLEARIASNLTLPDLPPGMQLVRDLDLVPPRLAPLLRSLEPGVHELLDVPSPRLKDTETDLFAAVFEVGGERLLLVWEVSLLEIFDEKHVGSVYLWIIGIGLSLSLLGFGLAYLLTRDVARDLGLLHRLTLTESPVETEALLLELGEDEIGAVAREFDRARSALSSSLQRERRFTRYASHELRTPITILRGCLELLERHIGTPSERSSELLSRMARTTEQMEQLVVVFLWLARGQARDQELDSQSLAAAIERTLRDLALSQRCRVEDLNVLLQIRDAGHVFAPGKLLDVVLRNLFSNSLRHRADSAPSEIECQGTHIRVRNQIDARNMDTIADPDSFGFGIAMVRDLCQRFGWTIAVSADDAQFEVRVDFTVRQVTQAPPTDSGTPSDNRASSGSW